MCANPRETGSFGYHIRRRPTRKRASDSVVRETATNVEVGARVAIVAATSLAIRPPALMLLLLDLEPRPGLRQRLPDA